MKNTSLLYNLLTMKHIANESQTREENEWYSKQVLATEKEIGYKWMKVQTVKIPPGEVAEAHIHKIQTEVFYFLTDNWYRIVNDQRIQPKVGDVLIIEPNDVHTVGNDTEEDYVYLCFKTDYTDQSDFYNV